MTRELEKRLRKLDAAARSRTEVVEVVGVHLPFNEIRQIRKTVRKRCSTLPIIHDPAGEALDDQQWRPESDIGL